MSTDKKISRRCVYTVITGGYEQLNEQPIQLESDVDFICFSDDENITSKTWDVRRVTPLFPMDATRSQREIKLRPYKFLPEYDSSLYIDNNVLLKSTPERIFQYLDNGVDMALPYHSYRNSVLDEFIEVAKLGLDEPNRIFEQLNHYSELYSHILAEKPYASGIMLRNHHSNSVVQMHELWFANICRYSRRDQLSLNIALNIHPVRVEPIVVDLFSSWFHAWPFSTGRKQVSQPDRGFSAFAPPLARMRALENLLADANEKINVFEQENSDLRRSADEAKLAVEHAGRDVTDLKAQLDLRNAAVERLAHELEQIKASRSWRLMGMARAAKDRITAK